MSDTDSISGASAGKGSPFGHLLHAMSQIQTWYLGELNGQPLDRNVFNVEYSLQFTTIALRSAFAESVIWILGYVLVGSIMLFFQENYLVGQTTQFFFWTLKGSPLYLFIKLSSFAGLAFSTVICIMMGRFYTGVVPKKAVNTLLVTRGIFLVSFSFVGFFFFGVLYKLLSSGTVLMNIYRAFSFLGSERVYEFIVYRFRGVLFEAGIVVLITGVTAAFLPALSIFAFRIFRRRKEGMGVPSN